MYGSIVDDIPNCLFIFFLPTALLPSLSRPLKTINNCLQLTCNVRCVLCSLIYVLMASGQVLNRSHVLKLRGRAAHVTWRQHKFCDLVELLWVLLHKALYFAVLLRFISGLSAEFYHVSMAINHFSGPGAAQYIITAPSQKAGGTDWKEIMKEEWEGKKKKATQHLQSLAEDIGEKTEYRLSNVNPK